jgi:excisionase family DNA binding protein
MTGGEDLLSLAEVAQLLGVHYMTAYRYVRTGRLRATKRGGSWVVDAGDLEQFRNAAPGAATSPPPGDAPDGSQEGSPARAGTKSGARTGAKSGAEAGARSSATRRAYPGRLEDRLVHGDEGGAWAVVEEALGSSMTPEEVYTAVMAPAMASIGERWARHELDIEDEHMASTIVQRLAGRLGPRFARRGRHRGTVATPTASPSCSWPTSCGDGGSTWWTSGPTRHRPPSPGPPPGSTDWSPWASAPPGPTTTAPSALRSQPSPRPPARR